MDAKGYNKAIMAAESGNACIEPRTVTLAAAAVNSVHNIVRFGVGFEILRVDVVHGALGSGSTVAVGLAYPDGEVANEPATIVPAAPSATANFHSVILEPIKTVRETIVTVTTGGEGPATGEILVHVTYRYAGTT